MDALNISTGEKHIAVTRDGAQVGEIVFNPSDVIFAEKFYRLIGEFQEQFTQYQEQARALAENKTVDANGISANLGEQIALAKDACTFIYTKIDALFGVGVSAIVFGDAMSLEAIRQFFEGVRPFIQNARAEKIQKYTGANGHKRKRK